MLCRALGITGRYEADLYLAIESCVLPSDEDHTTQAIITVYQKFSSLKALELRDVESLWDELDGIIYDDTLGELLVPFFPSLEHFVFTSSHYTEYEPALRDIVTSCRTLKRIVYSNNKYLSH